MQVLWSIIRRGFSKMWCDMTMEGEMHKLTVISFMNGSVAKFHTFIYILNVEILCMIIIFVMKILQLLLKNLVNGFQVKELRKNVFIRVRTVRSLNAFQCCCRIWIRNSITLGILENLLAASADDGRGMIFFL